jgi:hypothetical protein
MGYESGEVDGFFGPKTERAVLRFQQDKKIDADGIVGNQTWQALFAGPYPKQLLLWMHHLLRRYAWISSETSDWPAGLNKTWYAVTCQNGKMPFAYKTATETIKIFEHADWFGFRAYRLVVPKLHLSFKNLAEHGLSKDLKNFDGCFNPRLKRGGGSTWSAYGRPWAVAIRDKCRLECFWAKRLRNVERVRRLF